MPVVVLTLGEVQVASLFNIFREYVKGHPSIDPAEYLSELHDYGQIYYQFYHYSPDTPEALFFKRIEALDITTVFPLLLQVFGKLDKPADADERQIILKDIESFLVRRMVCELTTKNYNNLFLETSKKLGEVVPEKFGATLREHLLSQTSDIGRWPDDAEFWEAWRKLEAYRRLKPLSRLRMIMEALELERENSNRTEARSLNRRLSLEHVLPQGWRENWPLESETPESIDVREALIHTLGNLTLVTSALNASLSNAAWSSKRETLNKHSVLLLNADLQKYEQWDDAAIKSRSKKLFDMAKIIWPMPH